MGAVRLMHDTAVRSPLFIRYRRIIDIRSNVVRRVPQQILNNFGIVAILPQLRRIAVAKGVPALQRNAEFGSNRLNVEQHGFRHPGLRNRSEARRVERAQVGGH